MIMVVLLLHVQACRDLRLRGNDHFAAGDYHMAVAFYSKAVMLR